jgi:hypothetical protein
VAEPSTDPAGASVERQADEAAASEGAAPPDDGNDGKDDKS